MIIKLINQMRAESERYLAHLKERKITDSETAQFNASLKIHYDARVTCFSELLGILESGQPIENFLDEDGFED